MKPRPQRENAWRWLPFTACLLVFLFAFHAKTAVYGPSLEVKPDAATASKLCVKDKAAPPRPAPVAVIPHSPSLNSQAPAYWQANVSLLVAPGFAPVSTFSGLSPPLII